MMTATEHQAGALADALVLGGGALIDTIIADTLLPGFQPEAAWDLGDTHVDETRRYDETTRRIETTWTFTRDIEREQLVTSVRLYSSAELTELLAGPGSRPSRRSTASWSRSGHRSMRLWLVATV